MAKYLDHLYFSGHQLWKGRNSVFGAIFIRKMNRKDPVVMALPREALASWARAAPKASRDPMPGEACALVADRMTEFPNGDVAASALLVQYDCYMRPSEVLSVTRSDVSLRPKQMAMAYPGAVIIQAPLVAGLELPSRRAKNNEYDSSVVVGDDASAKVGRGFVAAIVRALALRTRSSMRHLFDLTVEEYELIFRRAVDALKLGHLRLVTHSSRHGPSTDAALQLRSLADIQRRGRWLSAPSVRRCEKLGKLAR